MGYGDFKMITISKASPSSVDRYAVVQTYEPCGRRLSTEDLMIWNDDHMITVFVTPDQARAIARALNHYATRTERKTWPEAGNA